MLQVQHESLYTKLPKIVMMTKAQPLLYIQR